MEDLKAAQQAITQQNIDVQRVTMLVALGTALLQNHGVSLSAHPTLAVLAQPDVVVTGVGLAINGWHAWRASKLHNQIQAVIDHKLEKAAQG